MQDIIETSTGTKYAFIGYKINGTLYSGQSATISLDTETVIEMMFVQVISLDSTTITGEDAQPQDGRLEISTAQINANKIGNNYANGIIYHEQDTYIVRGIYITIKIIKDDNYSVESWTINGETINEATNTEENLGEIKYYTNSNLEELTFAYTGQSQIIISCKLEEVFIVS